MKAVKIILNVFGVIISVILSIVLVAVLLVSPIISAASGITKPETIHKIITSIDYEKILVENGVDVETAMTDYGIPAKAVSKIMKTDAVKEVVDLYAQDFSAALDGEASDFLNPDAIKNIANEHIENLGDIAFQFLPENVTVTKEEVKQVILDEVNNNAEEMVSLLPNMQEIFVEQTNIQVLETVKMLQNGTFTTTLWVTIAVISLLILGCRFMRFKGFMWLGVVYLIGTGLTFLLNGIINTAILEMFAEALPFSADIFLPAVDVILAEITKIAVILLTLAVVFIAVFIAGRIYLSKRKKALADATQTSLPVVETCEAAEVLPNADNETKVVEEDKAE